MDLSDALQIAASGMKAQGTRLRLISENLANASSTSQTPGAQLPGEPTQRSQGPDVETPNAQAPNLRTADVETVRNDVFGLAGGGQRSVRCRARLFCRRRSGRLDW